MDRFPTLCGALALAIIAPCPAMAQRMPDAPLNVDDSLGVLGTGSPVRDTFALFEHGASPPRRSPSRARPQDTPDLNMAIEHRRPRKPPSFRRLIYLPHVHAAETQYALPAGLLDALLWKESRYNPLAVSSAGAAGLGQLMPKTAKELGVLNRFDPLTNLYAAAKYLRQQMDRFGRVHLALAAYNAGPGAVLRAGGIPRNKETPAYVLDILRDWQSGERGRF